jgi:uncharacterized protein (TIGR00156 family)
LTIIEEKKQLEMKNFAKPLMLIILLFACSSTYSQFVGTGSPTDSTSVSEIKKNALRLSWNDQRVKVKGFIVEQFDEDYFWFEDNTGRIKVEIEPKYMPSVTFDRNTEVVLYGEVCYPLIGRTYIGAKNIQFTGKKR